jgi:predicted metal-binding protein
MQDQDRVTAPPSADTTIYVCVTCRAEGDGSETRAGRRLHDALLAELGTDPAVSVVPVECLSVCRRPCTVSFAAPGKWTYVYGDLAPEGSAAVVAEAARLYGATADGLIPWKLRADPIKKGVVARVPPLAIAGQAA